jgi:diaminohydroxyphosphoribosylaminopyrimidine deaminase / 5-amino-6-(5-phosphoribosylamino)uracil reductase
MDSDAALLAEAVELSRRCPPSPGAYSVGAVLLAGGTRAVGWSRQTDPRLHAEAAALAALAATGAEPAGGTLYSSLEPCSDRRSSRPTCTELIIAAGITRVVFALREPPLFADCEGAELLAEAGIEVVERPDLAPTVLEINAALFD